MEIPKKLQRAVQRIRKSGEEPVLIVDAFLPRYCDQRYVAMARIGMAKNRIGSYLVVTGKQIHFVRTGVLWDSVQSVPLENITGIEYEKEFSDLTIKLKIGEAGERVSFYDELDGINFYKFMKFKRWEG